MAVPGQLDRYEPAVADFGQGSQDRGKIDLTRAEFQVLVDTSAHVLDLHVDHPVRGPQDALGHRRGLQATTVADVEGEAEGSRCAEGVSQALIAGEILDHHPRFGLESELDSCLLGRRDHVGAAVNQQVPGEGAGDPGRYRPTPERHRFGAEIRSDTDRPPQQVQSPFPAVGRCEGGAVLVPGVEQVPGARFDHDGEIGRGKPGTDAPYPSGEVGVERVEMLMIKRECNPVEAHPGQHGDDIFDAVVGKAVGAVAEAQLPVAAGAGVHRFDMTVRVGHVGDTRLARARATGKSRASAPAARSLPQQAVIAAWSGTSPRIPAPTACWTWRAPGSRTTAA